MVFLAASVSGVASAASAKRIAVLPVEGGGAKYAPVVAKIAKALKSHKIKVLSGAPVAKAVKKAGGTPTAGDDWVTLARKLKVDGLVASSVEGGKKGKQTLTVEVRNGADGSSAGEATFVAKGPPKKLAAAAGKGFWKKLGGAIKDTSAPAKEEKSTGMPARDLSAEESSSSSSSEGLGGSEEKSADKSADKSEDKSEEKEEKSTVAAGDEDEGDKAKSKSEEEEEGEDEDEGKSKKRASSDEDEEEEEGGGKAAGGAKPGALADIEVELDLHLTRRVFTFVPSNVGNYYQLGFTPMLGGRASWFPVTYAGLFVSGEFASWLKTGNFPTWTREFVIGAQGRFPLSFGSVGGSLGYFQHLFAILDANGMSRLTLDVPNTAYAGIRVSGDARVHLTDELQANVEAGYRLVSAAGKRTGDVQSSQYFPNAANPVAFDVAAWLGYRVMPFLEVRASFEYRRYVFGRLTGMTVGGNSIDATGALDQYVTIGLGAAGVFGGR